VSGAKGQKKAELIG